MCFCCYQHYSPFNKNQHKNRHLKFPHIILSRIFFLTFSSVEKAIMIQRKQSLCKKQIQKHQITDDLSCQPCVLAARFFQWLCSKLRPGRLAAALVFTTKHKLHVLLLRDVPYTWHFVIPRQIMWFDFLKPACCFLSLLQMMKLSRTKTARRHKGYMKCSCTSSSCSHQDPALIWELSVGH